MKREPMPWVDPLAQLRQRFLAKRSWQVAGFVIATAIFVVGGSLAIANTPPVESVQWGVLIAVGVVGVPLTIAMNVRRMQLSGAIIGISFSMREAFVITVASMASNVLPVPAGVMVRAIALKRAETSYGQVGSVTMATALLWLAGVSIVAAMCFWALSVQWLFLACSVAGFGAFLLAYIRVRAVGARGSQIVEMTVVQLAMVVVDTYRVFLVIGAIGVSVSYPQAGVLGLASFAGSAAGFAPGGLGVRELIAAGLGLVVGMSPAVAFVGTAVNRIVGLFVVGSICAGMSVRGLVPARNAGHGDDEG